MVVSVASLIIVFTLSVVLTFVFSSTANIFDNDLKKCFLPPSPLSRSSNSSLTWLLKAYYSVKNTFRSVIVVTFFFRCSSSLLVIYSSIRQPSNSAFSFISMSSKRLFCGVFVPSINIIFTYYKLLFVVGVVILAIYI